LRIYKHNNPPGQVIWRKAKEENTSFTKVQKGKEQEEHTEAKEKAVPNKLK